MKRWHDIVEIEKKDKVEVKNYKTYYPTTLKDLHMSVDKVHECNMYGK